MADSASPGLDRVKIPRGDFCAFVTAVSQGASREIGREIVLKSKVVHSCHWRVASNIAHLDMVLVLTHIARLKRNTQDIKYLFFQSLYSGVPLVLSFSQLKLVVL